MSSPRLSLFLKDLGYGSTFSINVIKLVFEQLSIHPGNAAAKLTDLEVGNCLQMMLTSGTQSIAINALVPDEKQRELISQMKSWNVELFFPYVKQLNSALDWKQVLKRLDQPNTTFFDHQAVSIVLAASKAVLKDMKLFPTILFLENWENKVAQTQFLVHICQIAPELFTNNSTCNTFVITRDSFGTGNAAWYLSNNYMQSCWNCQELVELVIEYSAIPALTETVGRLIEMALDKSPELLLLAFAKLGASWSPLVSNLAPKLVITVITGHSHWLAIISKLWELNSTLLVTGLALMYLSDNSTLSRALDVVQELKILPSVLEMKPYSFTLALAGLAARRDILNLEKWLQDMIRVDNVEFVRSSLLFINEKCTSTANLSNPSMLHLLLSTLLRVLEANRHNITAENAIILEKIIPVCQHFLPRLENGGEEPDEVSFPRDVEDEANSFFEKIYKGELVVPQVVEHLKRLQNSHNPRDVLVFKCMIHNLFDEYRFFARYPERELMITSVLFGVAIQNQIFTSMALGVALRYVLEALRQPVGSKLFQFGVTALARFQERLPEWPQYCALLLQIEHLHQALPEAVRLISAMQNRGANNREPEVSGDIFRSLNVNTLLTSLNFQMLMPNEQIHDRVLFIVNNVTENNIAEKIQEITGVLLPEHIRWFCNYIVVKRASIEPNFHGLYIKFLERLNIPFISQCLLFETLSSINSLINSETTLNSSSERSSLKNLGAWLGAITLAKDRPIKHRNLAVKDLLLEGYEHKRLIVVIPFVCKVLEQCTLSRVFKPPNPWMMAIMRVFAELYHFAELKLNLKFEIEVLCKNLKIDINEVEPSRFLRKNTQANIRRDVPKIDGAVPTGRSPATEILASIQDDDGSGIGFPALASYIVFNPNITLFNSQPALKRIVHIAIDRSIREVMQLPVVERSVNIAINATREIVSKDFSLEPNEEKMRVAAQYMAQSLAGNLASVSSREPLKVSIVSNLRSLLSANGYNENAIPEQLIFLIAADNLELACSVLERVAAEKSLPENDERMLNSFLSRRKHREQRPGQPYYDPQAYTSSRYLSALPEPIRPSVGGVTANQMRVYEDFLRVHEAAGAAAAHRKAAEGDSRAERPMRTLPVRREKQELDRAPESMLNLSTVVEKFAVVSAELERIVVDNLNASLESLGPDHPIKSAVQQIFRLISQSMNPDESCLLFAERIVALLYKANVPLSREVFVLILRRFFDISKTLPRELKDWFLYSEDERKFDKDIYFVIMRAELITSHEADLHLARLVENGNNRMRKFVVELLSLCCLGESPFFLYTEFLHTIRSIKHQIAEGEVELFPSFIEKLHEKMSVMEIASKSATVDKETFKKTLETVFEEWVEIASHPGMGLDTQNDFVTTVLAESTKVGAPSMPDFIKICLELGIKSAIALQEMNGNVGNPYLAVDALARLVVLLVRSYSENSLPKIATKTDLFDTIISIIVITLVESHDAKGASFNQKPFMRLFSSLLNELKDLQLDLGETYYHCIVSISNGLFHINPDKLPGFVFAWVQLISHRNFISPMMLCEDQSLWPHMHRLLVDYLSFLAPHITHRHLTETSKSLYRGTLRLLAVLLHDFPDFLCGYHHSLVNKLPTNCIQLKNLILSAFPPELLLPDPFTPNLKVDTLPEITEPPKILIEFTTELEETGIKTEIDNYLKLRTPVSFLKTFSNKVFSKGSNGFNIALINNSILYIGTVAIEQARQRQLQGPPPVAHNVSMDIFQFLLVDLDPEARYYFLGAIANQLRYPNNHTHYFSCVLLYLFSESTEEIMQEQITRVLIERLIVSRPYPYGLLITFIELIRNPRYKFWEHTNFIKSAPEIELLFQNVAKSMSQTIPTETPAN